MSPDLDPILKAYSDRSGRMFEDFGFPRISGQMGALLYLHRGPLSLDEISDRLGVSKGSASTNARFLEQMKFLRPVAVPGVRRDHYEFNGSLWPALKEFLEAFNRGAVADFKALNDTHIPNLEAMPGNDPQRSHMARQLKDLKLLYKFLDVVMGLVNLFGRSPVANINALAKKFRGEGVS